MSRLSLLLVRLGLSSTSIAFTRHYVNFLILEAKNFD